MINDRLSKEQDVSKEHGSCVQRKVNSAFQSTAELWRTHIRLTGCFWGAIPAVVLLLAHNKVAQVEIVWAGRRCSCMCWLDQGFQNE